MSHRRPTARHLQIVLGLLWLLDGLLGFQPQMLNGIVSMISPNAVGQAGIVAYPIHHLVSFLGRDVVFWSVLLGLVQVAIGVGLLWRRSVRAALLLSFLFSLGVWWIGEGFGGLFDGQASPLTGAPGAVALYAVVGLLVWPRREEEPSPRLRPALVAWATFWLLSALLWLLPSNRSAGSLRAHLSHAASGQPAWYGHMLGSLAHAFTGAGSVAAAGLCVLSLVIGVGPLFSSRIGPYLVAGAALSMLFWFTGQAVGTLLTGMASDPSTGPLVVLLAVAVWSALRQPAVAAASSPVPSRRQPVLLAVMATAVIAGPTAVAAVPVAAAPTAATHPARPASGGAMAGMNMGSAPDGGRGSKTMNMAAAAGLGVSDSHWVYTGAPLSPREVFLLDEVGAATDAGHQMQTPNCSTTPTSQQVLGSEEYVQATTTAVAQYKVLSAAVAAGYRPVTSTLYPIVHYVNPAYLQDQYVMDPNHVDSLVYAFTPQGPALVAAMYLMPRVGEKGPMPYGCLVQWHAHTNLCTSPTTGVIVGFAPCPGGEIHRPTAMMTHVWQVPVAGGPLAMDPPDAQVMEAAIMAQDDGLAPITSAGGQVTYRTDASATVGSF
jgi:hypothetical protein